VALLLEDAVPVHHSAARGSTQTENQSEPTRGSHEHLVGERIPTHDVPACHWSSQFGWVEANRDRPDSRGWKTTQMAWLWLKYCGQSASARPKLEPAIGPEIAYRPDQTRWPRSSVGRRHGTKYALTGICHMGHVTHVIETFAALAEPNRFRIVELLRSGA